MLDRGEVRGQQAEQGGAVHFRVAAHVVVQLRLERVIMKIVEGLVGGVLPVAEDRFGVPVVALAGQIATAFEQQDPLAVRQPASRGSGAAPRSAADDDHVGSGWPVAVLQAAVTAPHSLPSWCPLPGSPCDQCAPAGGLTVIAHHAYSPG